MNEQNNGGPAFPALKATKVESSYGGVYVDQYEAIGGLSIRDYFAAKAMQGLIGEFSFPSDLARNAYEIADTMLEARG